jgi:hypothetical protein
MWYIVYHPSSSSSSRPVWFHHAGLFIYGFNVVPSVMPSSVTCWGGSAMSPATSWRTRSRHQPRCVSVTALVICRQLSLAVLQHLPYCRKIGILRSSKYTRRYGLARPDRCSPTGRTLLTTKESVNADSSLVRMSASALPSGCAAWRAGRLQAAAQSMVAQVVNDAASLARKSNTEAISSGSPGRPSAVALPPSFAACGRRAPIAVIDQTRRDSVHTEAVPAEPRAEVPRQVDDGGLRCAMLWYSPTALSSGQGGGSHRFHLRRSAALPSTASRRMARPR